MKKKYVIIDFDFINNQLEYWLDRYNREKEYDKVSECLGRCLSYFEIKNTGKIIEVKGVEVK